MKALSLYAINNKPINKRISQIVFLQFFGLPAPVPVGQFVKMVKLKIRGEVYDFPRRLSN